LNVKPFEAGKTEYLFYVGCFGSFDARSKTGNSSHYENSGCGRCFLGNPRQRREMLRRQPARLGNEYVFDRMARENIKQFQDKGVTKIITECPHCFTTLKNEYAQYGVKFEVIHHTELIQQLLKEGKLKLTGNVDLREDSHSRLLLFGTAQ